MKNKNKIKKYSILIITVLLFGLLIGCNKNNISLEESNKESEKEVKEIENKEEISKEDSASNNIEKYNSIISTLTTSQYYAFVDLGNDYDILLVADNAYDNGDGNIVAIDATVYNIDNNKPCYAGSVWSDGTAYPIAVYENSLIFGGNHRITTAKVINSAVIVEKEIYEDFDENGNAIYYLNEGDIDNIKILENDIELTKMYDMYNKATIINFIQGEKEEDFSENDIAIEEDYPSNALEERVKKTSFDSYDEIIGLLEGDEAYSLVNIKGYDGKVLLVADIVYDDSLGHIIATECTPYTIKSNGKVTADSLFFSGGTATPLAIDKDGIVFTVTHQSIGKQCYGENGTDDNAIMYMTSIYTESLDNNGIPESISGFTRTENTVIDNEGKDVNKNDTKLWIQLWDEYEKAEPINFIKIN